MSWRSAIWKLALVIMIFAWGAPANAQNLVGAQQRAQCLNSQSNADPNMLIEACTYAMTHGTMGDIVDVAYAHVIRGIAYRRKGDNTSAIHDYDAAIAIVPRFAVAFANRGLAYLDQGDSQRAITDLNQALQIDRATPDIFAARGHAYANLHDLPHAISDYDRAANLDRNNGSYQNQRCWLRGLANSDLDAARMACDRALSLRANDGDILDSRGLIGLRQQRWQDAWNDYNAGVHAKPTCASCYFGRGVAEARLGRAAESQEDLHTATTLDSHVTDFYSVYGITP